MEWKQDFFYFNMIMNKQLRKSETVDFWFGNEKYPEISGEKCGFQCPEENLPVA